MSGPVLHVISGLQTGGAELAMLKLLSASPRLRGESEVLSLRERGPVAADLERLGIRVRSLQVRGTVPNPSQLLAYRRLLRKRPPRLVQGWMYHGNLAASVARWVGGVRAPVLWSVHHSLHHLEAERPATRHVIRLSARLSRRAARIIYASHASQSQHEAIGYAPGRAVVIPYGFDLERFRPSPEDRARVRAELRIDEGRVVIGLVARYHPLKDHANFLRAAAMVRERHPDTHFLCVGQDVTPQNPGLAALVAETGLEGAVTLLGPRSDVPALIASLDLLCSSSSSEALPNVIGEAMATQVPAVVTDVGDSAAILGGTGWVVAPRDAAGLAGALGEAIRAGREARRRRGEAARARIAAEYSLPAIAARFEQLYDEVLTGSEGP